MKTCKQCAWFKPAPQDFGSTTIPDTWGECLPVLPEGVMRAGHVYVNAEHCAEVCPMFQKACPCLAK